MTTSRKAYPLRFAPIYKEKIWGGDSLRRLLGRPLPRGAKIGESWELADLEEGASVVANGPEAGATLRDLIRRMGPALMGKARTGSFGRFPLLIKLLDAQEILSLQVHPDAATAATIDSGALPKTECWYVLQSRGGMIYKGLAPGVGPAEFRRAVAAKKIETLVQRAKVRRGEFHYLPGGTVHALGPNVVVVEIQTPSDTTYRVTDWARGRDVHVEQSIQTIRFGPLEKKPPGAKGDIMVACEHFTVAKRRLPGGCPVFSYPPGRCTALTFVGADGPVELRHAGRAEPVTVLAAGDTVLLPAETPEVTVASKDPCTWLETTLPER